MELRNDFSLLCLHQETQIFLRHLPLATQILATFIQSQAQAHSEVNTMTHTHSKPHEMCIYIYMTQNSILYTSCPEIVCNSSYVQMGVMWTELGFTLTNLQEHSCSPEQDEILSPPSSPGLPSVSPTPSTGPGFLGRSVSLVDPSSRLNGPSPSPSTQQVPYTAHPSPDSRPQLP